MLLALVGSAGPLYAQGRAERRSYDEAVRAFTNSFWSLAESNFGDFNHRYPASKLRPEAILFQAEARFELSNYVGSITLLSNNVATAGNRVDQYLDQMAKAYLASTNYTRAAETFAHIAGYFPNSPLRLGASIGEADALARLDQWQRVVALLQNPDGAFQQAAKTAPPDAAAHGYLLLGEAQLAQGDATGASATARLLGQQTLPPELAWRRWYLQARAELARNNAGLALDYITNNLAPLAASSGNASLAADTAAFQGAVLRQLNRYGDAITAYQKNLADTAPLPRQREALLSIADLSRAEGQLPAAIQTLTNFLAIHTNSPAGDVVLLALGELQLRQYASSVGTASTNNAPGPDLLLQAWTNLDSVLARYPRSPYVAKVLLDQGWCLWFGTNIVAARDAFARAANALEKSEDKATALFKWADAQYALKDYVGAVANYRQIIDNYADVPQVRSDLFEPALYQWFRAALEVPDMADATNALDKILTWYPNGFAGPQALVLGIGGFVREGDTAGARRCFERFRELYPTNALSAEAGLAVARTYEADGNWPAAITNYDKWVVAHPSDRALPRAEYQRAWANYMAGRETNALTLFTNFVARFATDELAPRAQFWVADHYFNQGAFLIAEGEYQKIFLNTNWPVTELTYEARLWAGNTAMARGSPENAASYYTNLTSNPNTCPPRILRQALFAYGDALMSQVSSEILSDTNRSRVGEAILNETNRARLADAIVFFRQITAEPTNDFVAEAFGRIGDCWQELAQYTNAVAAYEHALEVPNAPVAVRSQAWVGKGMATEKFAELAPEGRRLELLLQAVEDYESVGTKAALPGERGDPFWLQYAALAAGRVYEEKLNDPAAAANVYQRFQAMLAVPSEILASRIRKSGEQRGSTNR